MATTVWRGFITFGLVTIPVRLFKAARAERVSLRKLYRPSADDSPGTHQEDSSAQSREERANGQRAASQVEQHYEPITQAAASASSGSVISPHSVVKGYEYEKGRFVTVENEELKLIAAKTSPDMDILEFVRLAEIDPVYFETSYYVRPEEVGDKPYALLYRALQNTGLVAVGRIAMHGRDHLMVLRPGRRGIIAHTLFFANEVRAGEEYRAETERVTDHELTLSERLIHSLEAPWQPEKFSDTYREKLEAILEAKVAGKRSPHRRAPRKPAAVVDIAKSLERSLALLKRPVTGEHSRKSPRNSKQPA